MASHPAKLGRHIVEKQLQLLEYLIWKSKDATKFAKQCLIWMMRQSHGLSIEVQMSLGGGNELSRGVHDMISSCGNTHLAEIFGAAGSDIQPGSSFDGSSVSTVWIGRDVCGGPSCHAKKLRPKLAEIRAVQPAES
jgi:hypothetical protein